MTLTILAYHRVLEEPDPMRPGDMPLACFRRHMRTLARFFNVLPLRDAVVRLRDGSLPRRAVSITFDDGYADNYSLALPVLRDYGLPATVFVATGFLDGGRMWNDTVIESIRNVRGSELDLADMDLGRHEFATDGERYAATEQVLQQLKYLDPDDREERTASLAARVGAQLPDDLMLRRDQVRELSDSGLEIGAHTVTHPILKSMSDAAAMNEIVDGKERLEEIIGKPVRSFAYPNGRPGTDYEAQHVDLVRDAGFELAVSTRPGAATADDDLLQLPRFGPWVESSLRFGVRLFRMQ